jgi:uncharacterized protein (TIGR02246 family)
MMTTRAMAGIFVVGLAGALALGGAPAPAQGKPDPRAEVEAFVRQYVAAMNRADAVAVAGMFARTPEVSTVTMGKIVRGFEGVRAVADDLAGSEGTQRTSLESMDVMILGTAHALVVVPVTWSLGERPAAADFHGVLTLVLGWSGGRWTILHEHGSMRLPEGDFAE